MKKTFLLLLITLFSTSIFAQWEHREPLHGKIVQVL
jgi:hypothetical protein